MPGESWEKERMVFCLGIVLRWVVAPGAPRLHTEYTR